MIEKLIRLLPPETAHKYALRGIKKMKRGYSCDAFVPHAVTMESEVMGLRFVNPIGLAAGFDKNGEVFHNMLSPRVNFGFAEVGTVTPIPQEGNSKDTPRIVRAPHEKMLFNRLGLNNDGIISVMNNLSKNKWSAPSSSIIGINIGKNNDSTDFIKDYVTCVKGIQATSAACAVDYITLNISSPNSPGLRNKMIDTVFLREFFDAVLKVRHRYNTLRMPMVVKLSPDIAIENLEKIIDVINGVYIHGVCVGNTSSRLPSKMSNMPYGGYSGRPLYPTALQNVRLVRKMLVNEKIIIGCGGISDADDVISMLKAGASIVQLYTSLVYSDLGLVNRILADMEKIMIREGFTSIHEMIGINNT